MILFLVFIISCNRQINTPKDGLDNNKNVLNTTPNDTVAKTKQSTNKNYKTFSLTTPPISNFVRRIFQDKSGNLWFGTNGDGVIRYNGDKLKYFSINEGFGGLAVRGIVEDKEGVIWFATERGITKYDPSKELKTGTESFTNFTEKDGLINNDVWSIMIDSNGLFWIGTLQGISCFNGEVFTPFELPEAEPDYTRGVTSSKIVHSIMQDSQGKMWFGTNGGAYIYDGNQKDIKTRLTNISEKDGLSNNSVNDILEDKDGNIWFATHHKGVSRYNPRQNDKAGAGKSFTNFTAEGIIKGNEVWSFYEDKTGNIWFPAEHYGVYRYDTHLNNNVGQEKSFTNFFKKEGITSNAIQCIFEDKEGRLWLGGWMGLFLYDGKSFFNITHNNGPWAK